jgi:dimethylamine/trimethylamine dehydrogenase
MSASPRDPRYDVLFESVRIGPVTARNRFYQVPHCNGMGHERPRSMAAMRGVKAEGGWAVVSTEECEIHPTSDLSPDIEGRLWDDADIPALARMADAVHEHGALAAIQLVHNGPTATNRYSRIAPMGPRHEPVSAFDPVQARAMDKSDIRDVRRWHREAAVRAMTAGFDVITCYAGHNLALPMHFLQRRRNDRTDEYGGSLANRARLLREILEDTKDAVGHKCAVALRFAVDELLGTLGISANDEGREVVELLAELPDLWDVNVSDWRNDSTTSRFTQEGSQLDYMAFVKTVTKRPVVGVGRFTSPDTMVSVVKKGLMDFVGAARPSIADPFLPKKIEEGRTEDIRECIGCNICVSGDFTMTPIRCTQNPTMAEEWRKGWHPERIAPKSSEDRVLIVGAGPAGLECALWLGRRGHHVHLVEAENTLGGRVTRESALPGLAEWARVRDHRTHALQKLPNVAVFPGTRVEASDVRSLAQELGCAQVVLATGAHFRNDGMGRANPRGVHGFMEHGALCPDNLMGGAAPEGPVVVFDDDHYYMGGVIAELLRKRGLEVTLVTPAHVVSAWTANTLELAAINRRLLELGVRLITQRNAKTWDGAELTLSCVFTGRTENIEARSLVSVTARLPNDSLAGALRDNPEALAQAGIKTLSVIGDAHAPSTIAAAVYAGHAFARELGEAPLAFLRDGTLRPASSLLR